MNYLQYLEDLSKNIDEKHKTDLKNKESFAEVSTPYQLRRDINILSKICYILRI